MRLIVEVLDHWKDHGLTAGERADLIVIAENANDETRETFGPLHQPYILRRAGKSAEGWKNAIRKLERKDALAYAVRGHNGQHAVYRIPVLCPDPPHNGHTGHCTRPERVTSQVTLPSGKGHLSGGEGSSERWGRVTSQVTPTPLTPDDSSSPHARAARMLADAGASEDEARRALELVATRYRPRDVSSYLRRVESNGGLPDLVAEARADLAAAGRERNRAALRDALERAERDGPDCEHAPGGAYIRPDTGLPHCPLCRRRARERAGGTP